MGRPPRWTSARLSKKALDAHIAKWAAFLGLADWHIRYSPADPDPDASAQNNRFHPHKQACIRLSPTMAVAQVDRNIVHELLHIALWEHNELFEEAAGELPPILQKSLGSKWNDAQERLVEAMVDALTGDPRMEALNEGHEYHVWNSAFPLA